MSSPQITLYQYGGIARGATLSPPCGKVQMALRYKGLEFETRNLRMPKEVKAVNARGRMPALDVDGEVTVDSSNILDMLDERFPEKPLLPTDPQQRLDALLWEDWADEVLYFYGVWLRWMPEESFVRMKKEVFARLPIPLKWIIPGYAKRLVARRLRGQGTGDKPAEVVRAEFGQALDRIEAQLTTRPFLVGEALTRADLAVAALLDQLFCDSLPPALHAERESRPQLAAWLERVHEHAPSAAG